ncbi:hypothetical protein [Enterococcus wangshanyuanii]|uniref:Uncharacterized protein n=1 Tax=Enterococcus wangshanyuanii TaxID=2005703 RepID=A0ABQ1NIE0_9ENTE|nr:hypothetical protein [Enterococcus wangshanyuanii]GGC77938.1 hypothetical protein GCM10011573_04480 [Enterococcus wangshanyuanii]
MSRELCYERIKKYITNSISRNISKEKVIYHDELEKLGFEDPISEYEAIPEEYKSAKWMKSKNK